MTPVVQVWADIVCPWCYIGKRRLHLASAAVDMTPVVTHRAFQLDPKASSDGRLVSDVLAEKYGVSTAEAKAMMDNVSGVARSVGLDYRMQECVSGNTRDAHRLVLWAQSQGSGQLLLEELHRRYFTEGQPVFAVEDLAAVASDIGLSATAARDMLVSDDFIEEVVTDQRSAAELGATGVPFFVFDDRYAVAGAQPQEVFEQALVQANQGL